MFCWLKALITNTQRCLPYHVVFCLILSENFIFPPLFLSYRFFFFDELFHVDFDSLCFLASYSAMNVIDQIEI